MQFTRLRLSGFKSFVEPTEFVIERGLTGVVGPNGCGKSNLVEALRWVMGETSAKRMRGGAMEDVIFAGTATRPSRNIAEVSLQLDNRERKAPAAFNDAAEIEVTRRIEREHGSSYRLNGREVRARDVQLLFADLATGAQSTALVSQGRVGALINARPTDRRGLLEEAAGISGLHSRRHEAELRLRAAEANLERLEDVTQQLDAQLQGLKRQARQASRYRNLAGQVRRTEAVMFHLRYQAALEAMGKAGEMLNRCTAEVGRLTGLAAAASTAQAAAAETLPPLRQAEAEAAAALHRLAVARDGLEAEERRAREQQAALQGRMNQIAADIGREEGQQRDAAGALSRLADEMAEIEAARQGEAEAQAAAEAAVQAAAEAVAARQQELDALTERVAAETARRNSLNQQAAALAQRLQRLEARARDLAGERQRLQEQENSAAGPDSIAAEVERRRQQVVAAREMFEQTERRRAASQSAEAAVRERWQEAQSLAGRLGAEEKGLTKLLSVNEDDLWPPLIDSLKVAAGYEVALGAALGEDLNIASDTAAPRHWEVLPPFAETEPLPAGAEPLARYVEAPPALARRLSQIGVVEEAAGAELRRDLRQGQRLVSRSGGLWRWDGLTSGPGAPTAAAVRLEQRNRLADLREQLSEAQRALSQAQADYEEARRQSQAATQAEAEARSALRRRETEFGEAREAQAAAIEKSAARASRIAANTTAAEQIAADLAEAGDQQREAQAALAALPPEAEARAALAALRQAAEGLRGTLAEARGRMESLRRDAQARARRLEAIGQERRAWEEREQAARRQLAQLAERRQGIAAEIEAIRDLPGQIEERRRALLEQIAGAETTRTRAAHALAEAENRLADCDRAAKSSQEALATARELRVRAEAEAEHAEQHRAEVAARIRESLDCEPEAALRAGEVPQDEALPELSQVEMKLERLRKERDGMGPVNLRAEIESQEVEAQLDTLTSERSDLEAAIARLRQGISSLNKEGRERLLEAFKRVDEHFQALFVKVFGGGRAHLALTESDDPLEAGLEIMASPPGKKLQVMSLLSGGEQALTALSLLFAVFLTNPAPICVLDEVDAPLDDANVERLCTLLDEIVSGSETRFLVVTHHPITMARMDRLFGVTMAERGISQLVSVDLAAAERLRQTA